MVEGRHRRSHELAVKEFSQTWLQEVIRITSTLISLAMASHMATLEFISVETYILPSARGPGSVANSCTIYHSSHRKVEDIS